MSQLFAGTIEEAKAKLLENKSASKFSIGGKTIALCVKVYDGDTITLNIVLKSGDICTFNCRLNGIDTAEIKDKDPTLKALAILARDGVRRVLLDKLCYINIHDKIDKYGRPLVDIYLDEKMTEEYSLAALLIKAKLAVPYDGGKKGSFEVIVKK